MSGQISQRMSLPMGPNLESVVEKFGGLCLVDGGLAQSQLSQALPSLPLLILEDRNEHESLCKLLGFSLCQSHVAPGRAMLGLWALSVLPSVR